MLPSQNHTVKVDIFSDVVCPWCFIGKRRLEAAAALHGNVHLDIKWRGYLLNPDMPVGGMDRQDYINRKFGAGGGDFYARIAAVGRGIGIDFDFAAIKHMPDSRIANALVLATQEVSQMSANAVKEEILAAFFLHGQNISETGVLPDIALRHGLAYPPALQSLEDDLKIAQNLGIQGVPFFIISKGNDGGNDGDGAQFTLSGAHEPHAFLPLFDAVLAVHQAES